MRSLPYWRLSGYYFFYFAFNGAFMPYFGLYLQSLNFSAWDIGLLMSSMQVVRLFAPGLWGWLADRLQQRVLIMQLLGLLSLLVFSSLFWLYDFQALLLVLGGLSFFWSAALPLGETLTFNHLREASGQYSRIRLWGSIGFILAVLATGALLDQAPMASVLWVCWGLLAGVLAVALLVPEATPTAHQGDPPALLGLLRQPKIQALFAACLAMSAAHGALYVFYSIHLAEHGYSKSEVGALWSLGVIAEIVVFMGMSRLTRRFSLRRLLLACFLTAVLRFLLIGWGIDVLAFAVIGQVMHGLTFGAFHAASISAVNQWFPGPAQARGQALFSSVSFGAGSLLGGVVSGWMWDSLGASYTFTLSSAFALVGLVVIARWIRD